MTDIFSVRWIWGAMVLSLCAAPAIAQAEVDYCAKCHEREAALEKDHPHVRGEVHCTDCHGGDSTEPMQEKAKAEGTGYKGKLARTLFPNLCGDCHADGRRMNPFGLSTDQLSQYKTSQHGEAFFEEDNMKVATCVDCHGAHGILGARSSESPVHPKNVVATCSKCHSDPELVEEAGLSADVEKSYRASVHAHYLFEKGDLSAPHCATCHGNHGAVPPGFRDVGAVCGKCHVRQKELFERSPHAKLGAEGGFNACVSCHSNHEVRPAGKFLLDSVCKLCHEAEDKGLEVRDRLLADLTSVEKEFDATKARLENALELGHAHEDDLLLLQNARTAMIEMAALQHSLDPDDLETAVEGARTNLAQLNERIDSKASTERLKRLTLLPVVLFLVMMSLGFWVRFRRIHDTHEAEVAR